MKEEMPVLGKNRDLLWKFVLNPIYGPISVVIGLIGDFASYLLYPGYNVLSNMVSDLGTGPGGIYFNIGIFLSGIFALFLYIHFGIKIKDFNINNKIRKFGMIMATISCITFSLIGLFPSYKNIQLLFIIHGTLALISWISGIVYISIFSFFSLKIENIPNYMGIVGFIVNFLIIIFIFTWIPLVEWLMTLGIIFWVLVIYFSVKHIKKYHN
ncbi:MAG: DUF998 domain-containing protein [Candidatus Helarchaeota archaeon]